MIFNPDKCNCMVLGDSTFTFNFKCKSRTIESSKEEKVLDITIDDKLTFTSHLESMIKEVNLEFYALRRVKCYIGFEQNQLIMSSFMKPQFRHCLLIQMFCSTTSMNKFVNTHEKCLLPVTNNYLTNFNDPLNSQSIKPASTTS